MLKDISVPVRQQYQAAHEGVAYYQTSQSGWLTLSGPDRVDFLHRQSTQDLHTLSLDRAVLTVLTSPTAKILDVLWIIPDKDRLSLLTLPGRSERTAAFLRGKIFFMDKVAVSDDSNQYAQFDLIGPRAEELLNTLLISAPSGVGGVIHTEVQDIWLTVLGLGEWSLYPAYRLCVSSAEVDSLALLMKEHGVLQIGSEAKDVLRIEAGIPGQARELTEEYTPLEVRLEHAISDTKGCYTGQEVIARQISYDKVVRTLVGVKLSNQVDVGADLRAEGRPVGVLTSVGESPRFGYIGLAIVRRTHAAEGTSLEVSGTAKSIAVVSTLPFTQ